MNWQEEIAYNEKILDGIDIIPYLRPGADLYDIKNALEEHYSDKIQDDPWLEGELFNFLGIEDFALYLEKRYNLFIREEITYKIGGFKHGIN